MARQANLFSKLLERENAELAAELKKSPSVENVPADAPIHTTDGQSARILQMPVRRAKKEDAPPANDFANKIESKIEPKSEPSPEVTLDTWKWSAPPKFEPKGGNDAKLGAPLRNAAQIGDGATLKADSTLELVPEQTPATTENENLSASFRVVERPVYRTVEVNPENVEPHLVAITRPRSVHCEEFRNLRTRILHAAQRQKLQAITIASGSPSEGKSTVALNLAWLLGQTDGVSALIIDADLRLPCLSDYLDVEGTIGLSEMFTGETRLEDAVVKIAGTNLHLLPGGAPRDDVAEMLSGNRFRNILETARKQFDFIIVDAPSLGTFTDASILINQTDAALLVVRAGKTRYGYTNRLLETLPRERILGIVLNSSEEGLANKEHYDAYYNPERRTKN